MLWTDQSASSEWVRAEASHGRDGGILLAATLQTCALPTPFNLLQGCDLRQWQGDGRYSEWHKLVGALGDRIGRPGLLPYAMARASGLLLPLQDWTLQHKDDPLTPSILTELGTKAGEIPRESAQLAELIEQRQQEATRARPAPPTAFRPMPNGKAPHAAA